MDAVKRFQGRHALEPDGVIGPGTIAALNVARGHRVRQIELALERERWLPEMRSEPHVFVNVPLFRLWAYDPDRPDEPLRMNVVVGKSLGPRDADLRRADGVRGLPAVLEPAAEHHPVGDRAQGAPRRLVPRARRTWRSWRAATRARPPSPPPRRTSTRWSPGKLFVRQKPGEKNSLGLAKFIFPNAENIYMHGTPAQSLFARARRDFSHGCIRLEDPARARRVGAARRRRSGRGSGSRPR